MNYVHALEPTDPCCASNWTEFHWEVINRGISCTFVSSSVRVWELMLYTLQEVCLKLKVYFIFIFVK